MTDDQLAALGVPTREALGRIDGDRLRADRRRACLEAMASHDLDALVLGREANARYVSDVTRLWTAGTRPFGPGCVVLGHSGAVHLLTTWDDGVPADIDRAWLFGITWNGATVMANLAAIPGLAGARRIGVDGMSPGMARLLGAVAPGAELVDATVALDAVRRVKTADEVDCIRVAVAVAEAALAEAHRALRPGVPSRHLTGVAARHMAGLGVTIPDLEGSFRATSPVRGPVGVGDHGGPPAGRPEASSADGLAAGARVVAQLGALYRGYEGVVARTWRNGPAGGGPVVAAAADDALAARGERLWSHLAAACRPGGRGRDLLDAYGVAGEPLPDVPVAHGVGLGMEPPLVGAALPDDAGADTELVPGMVLFVVAQVTGPDAGTHLVGRTVLITGDGHECLDQPVADAVGDG